MGVRRKEGADRAPRFWFEQVGKWSYMDVGGGMRREVQKAVWDQ